MSNVVSFPNSGILVGRAREEAMAFYRADAAKEVEKALSSDLRVDFRSS